MKKKIFFVLVIGSTLCGCGSKLESSNQTESNDSTLTQTQITSGENENITELSIELEQDIDKSLEKWNAIKDQNEFNDFYTHTQSLVIELSQVINSIFYQENQFVKYSDTLFSTDEGLEDFENYIKEKLPFIGMTWVTEGTEIFFFLDKSVLLNKVKSISYQSAKDFFGLSNKIYGNDLTHEVGFPIWIDKQNDIQGISKLGGMVHYNTLVELNNQLSQKNIFSKELELIRNELIEDFGAYYFLHSKDSVLNELQTIMNDNLLSKEEQSSIIASINLIKSGNEPLIKFNAKFSDISNN